MDISIHAPRVGSDNMLCVLLCTRQYFNPRSPCGERRFTLYDVAAALYISIHAPRVGSDDTMTAHGIAHGLFQSTLPVWGATTQWIKQLDSIYRFQSTLPVWGATPKRAHKQKYLTISIHAPRVGSDQSVPR